MNWDGLGTPTWAGLANWAIALTDPVTFEAMHLTLVFVVVSFLFQAPIALLLGVFMASRQRNRAVLAVVSFLPLLFSSAAIGITFKALLDPNFGLSSVLPGGLLGGNWLGDPDRALYVVIFVVGWSFVPFHALLYQAGVRQIPAALYEAAKLDGAGAVKLFWYVTIPQLRYTIITSSTLMIVGSLTYFDLIFVLTGGGPGRRDPHPSAGHVPHRLPQLRHGPPAPSASCSSPSGSRCPCSSTDSPAPANSRASRQASDVQEPVHQRPRRSPPGSGWRSPSSRSTTSC